MLSLASFIFSPSSIFFLRFPMTVGFTSAPCPSEHPTVADPTVAASSLQAADHLLVAVEQQDVVVAPPGSRPSSLAKVLEPFRTRRNLCQAVGRS
eukprot:10265886-Heterocapsa_arctica.AAC.1